MVRPAVLLMHVLMASTVAFSAESQSVAAKRDQNPSLGRIQKTGRPWPNVDSTRCYSPVWTRKEMKQITRDAEYMEHGECRMKIARKNAHF